MEYSSNVVREVANLFERAENQANAIDSQKGRLIELQKQLETKYSTDTHILVDRKTLDDIADEFEAIADECDTIHSTINDINSYASSIIDDTSYADADNVACRATEQADDIRILLKTKDEDDE
tara:strand:+ start:860 stop:1228 length:369 start_codon:yes stop_codon:yes gene_type:complete